MSTEPNIKYRVTGALVLIALAVIFLPLILDGQKKNQILESNIPEKPVTGEIILLNIEDAEKKAASEKKDLATDSAEDLAEQSTSKTEVAKPSVKPQTTTNTQTAGKPTASKTEPKKVPAKPKPKPATVSETPVTKPKTDERKDRPQYKASAYVIQLGSFSNRANAQKIVDKLKAAGFKAYLKQGQSNGKTINRVLVGPVIERKKAESQITQLNKLSGLTAIILSYDPLRH